MVTRTCTLSDRMKLPLMKFRFKEVPTTDLNWWTHSVNSLFKPEHFIRSLSMLFS